MNDDMKPESREKLTENHKRSQGTGELDSIRASVLKKNEFTLILAGALVVTIIVFFLFFRSSSDTKDAPDISGKTVNLEQRIAAIETALEKIELQLDQKLSAEDLEGRGPASLKKELMPVRQNLSRLEASVSLKFDSLIERMGKLEKDMAQVNKKMVNQKIRASGLSPASKTAKKSTSISQPEPLKTDKPRSRPPVKKPAVKSVKKAPMLHTVKKGETLWSIARKYEISVGKLRELNQLSPEAKIYPGTNLLVR